MAHLNKSIDHSCDAKSVIVGLMQLFIRFTCECKCGNLVFFHHCICVDCSCREVNGKAKHEINASRKERPQKRGGGGRYEPYGNVNKRYRVFVSNIPYDVKWQALKDLMKEKGKVLSKGLTELRFGH